MLEKRFWYERNKHKSWADFSKEISFIRRKVNAIENISTNKEDLSEELNDSEYCKGIGVYGFWNSKRRGETIE